MYACWCSRCACSRVLCICYDRTCCNLSFLAGLRFGVDQYFPMVVYKCDQHVVQRLGCTWLCMWATEEVPYAPSGVQCV